MELQCDTLIQITIEMVLVVSVKGELVTSQGHPVSQWLL